jgi:sec-independent protein translocase protein TatA
MRGPQGWEWLVILVIVLLLFGARRLPDLARSVGHSLRVFRSEVKDGRDGAGDDDASGRPSSGDDGGPRA